MAEAADIQTQPFYLKKAKLKGYKSIKDAEVEFCDGLNIIIGKNASGKSNLLEILFKTLNKIDHFANSVELTIQGLEDLRISSNFTSNNLSDLNHNLVKGIKQTEYSFFYGEKKLEDGFYTTARLIGYNIPNPESYPIITSPFSFKSSLKNNFTDITRNLNLKNKPFLLYRVLSLLSYKSLKKINSDIEFNEEKFRIKYISNLNEDLNEFNKLLGDWIPIEQIRYNPNINIHYEKGSGILTFSNIFIEYEINGSWLPYSNLSDGTKRLFYIISEIDAGPFSFIFEKEITKATFFIEEPELGIHPHQLHQLMTFIKEQSRDKQIILSTHSPMVLDVLGKDDLHRIIIASNDDPKKGSQFRHLTEEEKDKARLYMDGDYLSDYWKYSNLEG